MSQKHKTIQQLKDVLLRDDIIDTVFHKKQQDEITIDDVKFFLNNPEFFNKTFFRPKITPFTCAVLGMLLSQLYDELRMELIDAVEKE